MVGADIKVLTDVYLTLKKQLDELKTQVDELKVANQTFHDVKDTINELNAQYRFIRDFDPKAEVRDLQSWGDSTTRLDDFGEARSFEEKWSVIEGEIDRRVDKATQANPHAAEKSGEAMHQTLAAMKENDRQLNNYRNAARYSTNADNARYLQQLQASSSAMTASLLLEQKQARMEEEIRRREILIEQIQWEHSFLKFLSKE
jgi:hypothetical protein